MEEENWAREGGGRRRKGKLAPSLLGGIDALSTNVNAR